MSNHRELLKSVITKLTVILVDLEDIETCLKCSRPATARGFCGKHYSQWRREYCRERQIKKIRDVTEVLEPDPRQTQLFIEAPDIVVHEPFKELEF